jgi:hypothetical protein
MSSHSLEMNAQSIHSSVGWESLLLHVKRRPWR